jgi:hypothetical protein
MRIKQFVATGSTLALLAVPVAAVANNGHHNVQKNHQTTTATVTPAQREAYGRDCRQESRRHVHGEKGTPFSQCVTALAKLDNGTSTNPAKACKGLSKKHKKGQKGTPYSRCVSAAAKLRHDHQPTSPGGSGGGTTGTSGASGPTGATGATGPKS